MRASIGLRIGGSERHAPSPIAPSLHQRLGVEDTKQIHLLQAASTPHTIVLEPRTPTPGTWTVQVDRQLGHLPETTSVSRSRQEQFADGYRLASCGGTTPLAGRPTVIKPCLCLLARPPELTRRVQGTEAEALDSRSAFSELSPTWKLLLLSDGSVTRHLQLLTDQEVAVECLEMRELPDDAQDALPSGAEQLTGPLLQRQVFLRAGARGIEGQPGPPLVYATSWWNAAEARRYLHRQEQPIWVSLQGTELRRDIKEVCCGRSPYLEQVFGESGPLWARHYVFWHGGKALTVIHEAFSPRLQQFLGPVMANSHSSKQTE